MEATTHHFHYVSSCSEHDLLYDSNRDLRQAGRLHHEKAKQLWLYPLITGRNSEVLVVLKIT